MCWQGYGETGTLVPCWGECKMTRLLWKTVWWRLKKLKRELPCDPAVRLLGPSPQELKAEAHVPSSTVHNRQNADATQVSINRHKTQRLTKYNGMLFSL